MADLHFGGAGEGIISCCLKYNSGGVLNMSIVSGTISKVKMPHMSMPRFVDIFNISNIINI